MKNIYAITFIILGILGGGQFALASDTPPETSDPTIDHEIIEKSVFKIAVTLVAKSYKAPYVGSLQHRIKGSGFFIMVNGRKRIMTNAHVASNALQITAMRPDRSSPFVAHIEFIDNDADMAILMVDNERLFDGLTPLNFAHETQTSGNIKVYGYPTGGTNICIPEGVITRIDLLPYSHSGRSLLLSQTDAALNPGTSGGPVINEDGKVLGIATQGIRELQNTGYFIPLDIVNHFIEEANAGEIRGYPDLGIRCQDIDDDILRRAYRLTQEQTGMIVREIAPTSPLSGQIEIDDIILAIDEFDVDDYQKIKFKSFPLMYYTHYISQKLVGDTVRVTYSTGGVVHTTTITLATTETDHLLVPKHAHECKYYKFFIYSNFLFQTGNEIGLREFSAGQPPFPQAFYVKLRKYKQESDEELVFLREEFSSDHRVQRGYFNQLIVDAVADAPVRNLLHLVLLLEGFQSDEESRDGFIRITFKNSERVLIIDPTKADAVRDAVLRTLMIPQDRYLGEAQDGYPEEAAE